MTFKRTVPLPKIGERFGRLVTTAESFKGARSRWFVNCKCDCGNTGIFDFHNLRSGNTVSCGCYEKDYPGHTTHNGTNTPLYTIWSGMRSRCRNEKSSNAKWYLGRGIKVCKEWEKDFACFRDWALSHGYQDGLELDRIDGNKNYTPQNCRWVTHQDQMNNMSRNHRLTAFGETKTMMEWSRDKRCKVSYITLKARINDYGWDAELAITKKVS